MNTNQVSSIITEWDTINSQAFGAPGGVVAGAFVFVLCIFLAWVKWFPNDQIPRWSIFLGIAMFFLLSPPFGGMSLRVWIGKNLAVGFIESVVISMAALKWGPQLPYVGKYLADLETTKPTVPPETKD